MADETVSRGAAWPGRIVAGVVLLGATLIAYRDVLGPDRELFFRDHPVIWKVRWRAIAERLFAGEWPALTHAHSGGIPLESLLNGTYTPGVLLLAFGDFDVTYDLFVALHTFVLATGVCVLARELAASWSESIVAGLVAGFAGPALSLENLVVISIGLSYAPWVYVAFARCLRRAAWDRFALLALAVAFHLQGITPILALLDVGVAAWLVIRLRPPPAPRLGLGLVAATALALGMASIQLGPFLEAMVGTQRGAGFDYGTRAFWALSPIELTEFAFPTFLHPRATPYLHFGLHRGYAFAYFESFYFGTASTLALFGFAALKGRQRAAVLGVALFALLMALGDATPVYRVVSGLPVLKNSRFPSKYVLLLLPVVAALAAVGVRHLTRGRDAVVVIAALPLVSTMGVWSFVRSDDFASLIAPRLAQRVAIQGIGPAQYGALMRDHMAAMMLHAAAFSALVLVAALVARRVRASAAPAVAAIVALDLAVAAGYAVIGAKAEPRTVPAKVAEVIASDRLRHYPAGSLPPAAPGYDETHFGDIARESKLRGTTALRDGRRAADLGWEGVSHPASKLGFELVPRVSREGALDLLRRAGIRWVLRDTPAGEAPPVESEVPYEVPGSTPQYLITIADVPDYVSAYTSWRVVPTDGVAHRELARAFRETARPRGAVLLRFSGRDDPTPDPPTLPCTETATVTIDEGATTEGEIVADVTTACPSIVVALELQAPSWRAEVDGVASPIFHAELGSIATSVPAGTHRVRFFFEPRTPYYARVAGASLLATAGLFALGRARRRRR